MALVRPALLSAVCAVGIVAATLPATAQDRQDPESERSPRVERPVGFTPANGDPRLAAAYASRNPGTRSFSFTPANPQARDSRLRVEVNRRDSTAPRPTNAERRVSEVTQPVRQRTEITQSSYNLGVDVGWKRFGLTGEVGSTRSTAPSLVDREGASVGVSYDLKDFEGRVTVSADRQSQDPAPAINPRDSYALDVGGAIKVTRNIAVTGGVRYRIDQERLPVPNADGARVDSQAVYVGGALKF
ncbi:hypothetical protein [Sphingomicrobium sediminis]|uniref:Porin n=1 Tax=Sphingomicrobium sediminis TaxID=2950949 RepID=A0A9X2J3I2_9SPHN|nr:hypothetical protein [Sphingomicrobium sediminis]MCM8558070.1 hypothetical protein [Sphingomicrobium sediminis]